LEFSTISEEHGTHLNLWAVYTELKNKESVA
jgi:hypothetical protein